jgi:hypothetical protein
MKEQQARLEMRPLSSNHEPANPTAAIVRFLFVSIRVHSRLLSLSTKICVHPRLPCVRANIFAVRASFSCAEAGSARPFIMFTRLSRPKTWVTGARLFHVEQH